MALTPEQVQQFRSKYNVGPDVARQPKSVEERIARLRSGSSQAQAAKEQEQQSQQRFGGVLGGLEKFGKTLGEFGVGVGKGVLSTAKGVSSLGEKALQAPLKAAGVDVQEKTGAEQLIPESATEAVGSAQKAGKAVEQLGEFLLPSGTLAKLGKAAQAAIKAATGSKALGLGGRALTTGGAFGGIESAQEGELSPEGFATGVGVEAAAPVLGKIAKPLIQNIEKLPSRFVRSALGRNKKQVIKDIKDGKDDLADFVLRTKGRTPTLNKLFRDSSESISKLSQQVNNNLKRAIKEKGDKAIIGQRELFDRIARLDESKNALLNRVDISEVVGRLVPQSRKLLEKKSLSLDEANKLRQLMDRTLGDRGFIVDKLPSDKEVLRNVANTLREEVKKKAPSGTRELFEELSSEIRLNNTVLDRLASRSGNEIINLGDILAGGFGGLFGGGIGGSLLSAGVLRFLRSTPFKIGSARGLNFTIQNMSRLQKLSPQERATIIKLIDDIDSDEESDN